MNDVFFNLIYFILFFWVGFEYKTKNSQTSRYELTVGSCPALTGYCCGACDSLFTETVCCCFVCSAIDTVIRFHTSVSSGHNMFFKNLNCSLTLICFFCPTEAELISCIKTEDLNRVSPDHSVILN